MTNTFLIEIAREDFKNTIKQFDDDDLLIASVMLIERACELNKNNCQHCLFNNGICRKLYQISRNK